MLEGAWAYFSTMRFRARLVWDSPEEPMKHRLSVSSWKVGADSSALLVGSQSVRILVPAKSWVARALLIASSCVTGLRTAYTTCLVQEGKNIKGSSLLPVWKRQSMEARQSLLFSFLSSSQMQSLVATWFLLLRTRRSLLWAIETYLES